MGKKKKFLFLFRKAPHGTLSIQEGLEAARSFCSLQLEVTLLFLDDAVFCLKKGQNTSELGTRDITAIYDMLLNQNGVKKICVKRKSMEHRGLTLEDLILDVDMLSESELIACMEDQDVILPF